MLIDKFEPNTVIEQPSIVSTLIATISVYRLAGAGAGQRRLLGEDTSVKGIVRGGIYNVKVEVKFY